MAETRDRDQSKITEEVGGSAGGHRDGAIFLHQDASSMEPLESSSPRSLEARIAALELAARSFTDAASRISRIAEQVAALNGRISRLESVSRAHSANDAEAAPGGSQMDEKLRQLDERLQKLANALAEQNWSRS